MTVTQAAKAQQFRALHEAPGAFVVANVWDGGSARMMASLGFAALATSSGASAGLLGRRDGRVTRDEALAQARVICDATDLPVSADREKGFGDAPEIVAETIRLAAQAGLVGCSIEDATGDPDAPIFELRQATERIAAAAAAARALPFPFTLTGRTENFLRGQLDLGDTIKRLKAYEAAGANRSENYLSISAIMAESSRQHRPSKARRKKRRIGAFSRRLTFSDLDGRTNAGKYVNSIKDALEAQIGTPSPGNRSS
jgi:2-methylisocitrate lyase-like PEP mutase family enzyme